MSGTSSYVAITRVKRRKGLLIFREFPLEPFTTGVAPGVDLLLRKMRGENIDWEAEETKLIPRTYCVMCKTLKQKQHFTEGEFNNNQSVCRDCDKNCRDDNKQLCKAWCLECKALKTIDKFTKQVRKKLYVKKVRCLECNSKVKCSKCDIEKDADMFSRDRTDGLCKECAKSVQLAARQKNFDKGTAERKAEAL